MTTKPLFSQAETDLIASGKNVALSAGIDVIAKGIGIDAKRGLIPEATVKSLQADATVYPRRSAGIRGGQRRGWIDAATEADDGPADGVTLTDRERWAKRSQTRPDVYTYTNGPTIVEFRVYPTFGDCIIAYRGPDSKPRVTVSIEVARETLRGLLAAGWGKW